MLNCQKCGQMIAGLGRLCPACLALQSRAAIFQMQASHLVYAHKGLLQFYLKRLSAKHPWHVMLFMDRAHGYCGIEIAGAGKPNRFELNYEGLQKLKPKEELCVQCLHALREIEERAAIREEA